MNITDEITDERTRKYCMVWVDEKGEEHGLDYFKGKKSELPQEIVVANIGGQKACKLEQIKMVNGRPWAVYRFDGWAYRKWFAI